MSDDIKSMGLYRNVERILADLEATGIGPDDPLTVDDLTPFDQYHYEGTSAVDDAAVELLGGGDDGHILDLGAGLGGPARYLADRSGAQVTALELQDDLDLTASALTARCGLDDRVSHLCGNMLEGVTPDNGYTGIMSMLCVLHIEDRATLFAECARSLRPGGVLFIDDYVDRSGLTAADKVALADKVFCPYVPDLETYTADVEGAGFDDVRTVDKSTDWTEFVVGRLDAFRSNRDALLKRYDAATVDSLDDFYATVVDLFVSGRLGGLRLIARLPS